jgi:type VI secretion system secreted protein VgrG
VQFRWDLEGQDDDKSSCWLRVAQAWAGVGWGAQFIPRVGMEVVVTFLGGDLDRPLVTGCVYNATHPPAFPLPDCQTRSGIRSWSTPNAVGANELSFEDAAGQEQVYLHAQRNYDEEIEANRSSKVGGSRSSSVAVRSFERVGENARLEVAGERSTRIDGADRLEVGARLDVDVTGDHKVSVAGEMGTTVLLGHTLEVRGSHAVVVGTEGEDAQSNQYVYGSASIGAKEQITLRADQGIVLVCGDTRIELSADKITLTAPTIEITPSKSLTCATKDGPTVTLGSDVEILTKSFHLFTESGAVEVDKEFKVQADKIKLGYDPSKPADDSQDATLETKPIELKLSDWFLDPYAGKTYHVLLDDGRRLEGETDGEGTLKEDVPKTAEQLLVRLWLDEFPEGRQQLYRVDLRDVPGSSDTKGAQQRLKNLGYFDGPIDGVMGDGLRAAVAEFQCDHADTHGLDSTGDLDEGTSGALEEVHGS